MVETEVAVHRIPEHPEGGVSPRLNAVFVHGLGGGWDTTWVHKHDKNNLFRPWHHKHDENDKHDKNDESGENDKNDFFWPLELARDLNVKGLAVYSIGYPAETFALFSHSGWPIPQSADAVLDRLISDPALNASGAPIVFVCHSLGGLVVKKLIHTAQLDREFDSRKRAFLDRIVGVVFLATPHGGSGLATVVSHVLGAQDSTRELKAHDLHLEDLSVSYRSCVAADGARIRHLVYYETEKTDGKLVVDATSADPGITGVRPVAIGRNHSEICKPPGPTDQVYQGVLAFLQEAALAPRSPALRKNVDASDRFYGSDFAKTFSYLAMTALGAFVTWLIAGPAAALGPAPTALLSLLGGISSLALSLIYGRYTGILSAGAEPETSPERRAYNALRQSLARGNLAARLYPEQLTRFLNWIERFFGDTGMADRTLFPHAFGLKKAAPLWTAPAFDRCLFLALIYPVATILIIWTVSGHAGPAEMALGLKPDVPGWSRGLIVATAALQGFVTWTLFRGKRPKSIFTYAVVALCAVAGAAALAFAFGSSGAGAVAFGVAVAASVASAGRAAGAVAVAAAIPTVFGLVFGLAGASMSTVAWVFFIVGAASIGTLLLCAFAIKHQAQGIFLLFFMPAMIPACLAAVKVLSHLGTTWPYTGPLLLFLGLLTLLNAPFDWASLGLTRALLRRGLELKGWWPYVLALVDACLAGVIVALLALIMVVGVQAFDELAVHGGGEKAAVLPLDALFDGIAKNPAAPEYWWVYALLLSSMIPSLINLMIGGTSLLRGIPGLASVLLRFMPAGKAPPAFERAWLALVLTGQIFAGAFLGI
ncbi:MAG: esterase/lipase family protein, partial [Methylocella sp.]